MSQRRLNPEDTSFTTQDKSGGGLLPSIQASRSKTQGILVIDEDQKYNDAEYDDEEYDDEYDSEEEEKL
jgi:hypothetical protein